MPYTERTLPTLEAAITALNLVNNDLLLTNDGLGDSDLTGLANPGTVTNLLTAIKAFPWKEKHGARKDFIISAIELAANPIFPLIAVATSATPQTSGGSLADGAYKIKVTAFDRFGKESAPIVELTATVSGGGGNGRIDVLFPATRGAVKFRVYFTAVGGAADTEDRYKESAATAAITSSTVTVQLTTTTISGAVVAGTVPRQQNAGFGYLCDIDVEVARAAGSNNYTGLRNAVADQHPQGTAMRPFIGAENSYTYNTTTL